MCMYVCMCMCMYLYVCTYVHAYCTYNIWFMNTGHTVHVWTPYCICMLVYECTFTFSLRRIGRKSPRLVRAAAMRLSGELFSLLNRSKCAMVTKVLQGCVSKVLYVCVCTMYSYMSTYVLYVLYVCTYFICVYCTYVLQWRINAQTPSFVNVRNCWVSRLTVLVHAYVYTDIR